MIKLKIVGVTLLLSLSSFFAHAQAESGQRYLSLRNLGIVYQNNYLFDTGSADSDRLQISDVGMHFQYGKMLTERRSVGLGLIAGYNYSNRFGDVDEALSLGLSGFLRQWMPVHNTIVAHIDYQAAYIYTGSTAGSYLRRHEINLGVMPGLSWFFCPKWSLEGRMTGIRMLYRYTESGSGIVNHLTQMNYNVNLFDMQFAISRFF